MGFYDKFENLCKENGVTPTRVAREIGIAQQSVSLWKKRGSIPSGENLQKLADYFGVTVDYLLGNEAKEINATPQDDEMKNIWDNMKNGKNQVILIGYDGKKEYAELNDDQAAMMRAIFDSLRKNSEDK